MTPPSVSHKRVREEESTVYQKTKRARYMTLPDPGYAMAAEMIDRYVVYIPRKDIWKSNELSTLYKLIRGEISPALAPDSAVSAGIVTGFFHLDEFKHIDNYTYSGVQHKAKSCTADLEACLRKAEVRINKACDRPSVSEATHFHANRYEPVGKLGPHADSEKNMDLHKPIISLSFGSSRTFRVHIWFTNVDGMLEHIDPKKVSKWNKQNPGQKCNCYSFDYTLEHGDVIVMLPGCQQKAKHSIVACKKRDLPGLKSDNFKGIRHNITLRTFVK